VAESCDRVVPFFLILIVIVASGLSGCRERGPDPAASTPARTDAGSLAAEAKAREEAAAAREAERLAALWTYYDVAAGKGRQLSATIYATSNVETDGKSPTPVRLVFRDHPSWGRSSYLVLEAGDFDCYGGCSVAVRVNDDAPKPMAARRPKTDDAIAMFINDARAFWRLTANAKRLSVEFPVKARGTRTASFEVGGLNRSKMPGWDAPAPGGGKN